MTFDDAEKMVADNLHLTQTFSSLKSYPFYLRHLVIIPEGVDSEVQTKIYTECLSNGYDNKEALISLGLPDSNYDVIIMGFNGEFKSAYPLEKYLEESQYKS